MADLVVHGGESAGPPLHHNLHHIMMTRLDDMDEDDIDDSSPISSPPNDNDASSTSSGIATDASRSPRFDGRLSSENVHLSPNSEGSSGIDSAHSPRCQPEKKHLCDICGKAFPYMSILESHKRCHTGEKPFKCHFCDKKFAQKATLQVHERTHTGERPYKCRYCDKTFAQYGTKTVHEKSAHLGIRNYKCPKCDKCLSSPSALYTHKKTHGEKVFNCQFCPKTFTLKNYLKLHVRQVHEQTERKHTCNFCHKSFSYAGSLQVHIRTHTGERPYICRYCPKAFASQGNLQSHERTHTGERPYMCDTCGRSFIQKSQLTAHEATHNGGVETPEGGPTVAQFVADGSVSGQEKPGDHACAICGKRYAYASSLYVHARVHTGERPFSCTYCDKTFTNQGNMQVHLRVHTGEKPYRCVGCDKSYAQKVGLQIHHESCQAYITASNASSSTSSGVRSSQSPINAETSDDDSLCRRTGEENVMLVEGRKLCLDTVPVSRDTVPTAASSMSIPNIYANIGKTKQLPSAPSAVPLSFTPCTVPAAMPFSMTQLSNGASGAPGASWTSQPLGQDYGPMSGAKAPTQMSSGIEVSSITDSLTSAFAPVQTNTTDILKGILDHQQQLLTSLLIQQLSQRDVSAPLTNLSPPTSSSTLDILQLLQQVSTPNPLGSTLLPPSSSLTGAPAAPSSHCFTHQGLLSATTTPIL